MSTHDLIVGTFNTPKLYTLRFTIPSSPNESGKLEVLKQHSAIGSHSWLHLSKSKRNLYATAWTEPPTVAAYAIESPTSIKLLNTALTNSRSGYVCASETHAYSAGGATGEVFALDAKTGAFTLNTMESSNVNASNSSVQPVQKLDFVSDTAQRDDGSTMDFGGLRHGAHSADLSPDGKLLYIADIGRNCIWTYSVRSDSGSSNLTLSEKHISPRSHDGPRHVHPHPNGRYVYCLQEHSSVVDVFEVIPGTPTTLRHVQGVRIIPAGLPVNEFWADEVRTSLANDTVPQFLYASTRGLKEGRKGYVAVYKLDADGLVEGAEVIHSVSQQQSGGKEARDDDVGGLVAMFETATSGGWANAVEPGPNVDGVEYLALTDSEVGYVFVLGWNADAGELKEVARVNLSEVAGDGKREGAATAVWL